MNIEKDKDRVLVLAKGKGQMGDNLTAEEAFLLSRLDGQMKLKDLLLLIPFSPADAEKYLDSLFKKNILSFKDQVAPKKEKPAEKEGSYFSAPPTPTATPPVAREKLSIEIEEVLQSDKFDSDIQQLEEGFRKDILKKLEKIEEKNPFDILGVRFSATDHEVRSAYLELSRKFHPDRFFRRKLGHYKKRLDLLFTHIQQSYESLKDPFDREAAARTMKSKQTPRVEIKVDPKKIDASMEKIGKAEHFFKLGQAALAVKDYAHAATQFQFAMQLNPDRPQYKKSFEEVAPFLQLAKVDSLLKEAEDSLSVGLSTQALAKAEDALRISPDSPQAKLMAARAILEGGEASRFRDAIEMLRRAKAGLLKNPEPCILLAQLHYARKEKDKAILELEEALKRDPESSTAHKLLIKYSA